MNSNLTVSIHTFVHDVDAQHAAFAAPLGLSVMGMLILNQLYHEDGVLASALAQSVGKAATSFTPQLDRLQDAGLICRKPHPNDRRAVQIFLTEKGKALRKAIVDHMNDTNTRLRDLLSARIGSVNTVDGLFAPLPEAQAN